MPMTPERDDSDDDALLEQAGEGAEDFVRNNPLAACGIAIVIGFVVARVLF